MAVCFLEFAHHICWIDMKLHWGPISPFVRKVMICAHETGLDSHITKVQSLVAMNLVNENVMLDNPLSKIPTLLRDDGVALFDSDVICEYFDTLHVGPRLIPEAGEERFMVLRWNALGSGMLDALILWRNERMRPEGHRSMPTIDAYARKIAATLDLIEREIPLLEARRFGLGHVAIGCAFGYLDARFDDIDWRADHPLCARWFLEFSARPSAQLTHPALATSTSATPATTPAAAKP
jgi:glutathione S-transferase